MGIEETKSEMDNDDEAVSHVRGTSMALAEYDDDFDDFDFDVFVSNVSRKNSETVTMSKSETDDNGESDDEDDLIKTIKQAIDGNDNDNLDQLGHVKRSTE